MRRHEQAAFSCVNISGTPSMERGRHRQACRHGFQKHVGRSFAARRQNKDIGCRVGLTSPGNLLNRTSSSRPCARMADSIAARSGPSPTMTSFARNSGCTALSAANAVLDLYAPSRASRPTERIRRSPVPGARRLLICNASVESAGGSAATQLCRTAMRAGGMPRRSSWRANGSRRRPEPGPRRQGTSDRVGYSVYFQVRSRVAVVKRNPGAAAM